MDLARFLAIIQATPTLSDEHKRKHAERAATYSPVLRGHMANIIAEEEMLLIGQYQKSQESVQIETMQRMDLIHKKEALDRQRETADAEGKLESFKRYG
ncbi:MAG TPA: hypothetical protein PK765_01455 [bacterium]|nr:hypothetical protein [bacterium]